MKNQQQCSIIYYSLFGYRFNPWKTINSLTGTIYEISLCEKLSSSTCTDGTSVCAQYKNGTAKNFGSHSATPNFSDTPRGADGELLVSFQGQACENSESFSTILYFKCGKTLGYPKYLGEFPCSVHFEWASYLFCKNIPVPDKEVPCSVVKDGSLIDLTPLIKLNGGYPVESTDDQTDILINVCRDITEANNDKKNCTKGSAVCKIKDKVAFDFGNPKTKLEATILGVRLIYTSSKRPSHCSIDPTTTINFICPKRGGSKNPVILTDFAATCSMTIEWITEYACPAEYLISNKCQLNKSQHGINIDLSELKRKSDDPYVVNATDGEDHYAYYLNVCDNVNTCGKTAPVCQRKWNDKSFESSVGLLDSQQLTYSDGALILSYRNGDICSSNFKRETIIEFVCNQSAADNGKGYPEFVVHSNCSYFFKWGTKYACVEQETFQECTVESGGKKYDLSALVRSEGTNWEVLTGESDDEKSTYFLNVCHDLLRTDEAQACPAGSAVCRIGSSGAQSVGQLSQGSLRYNPSTDSLTLTYTGGANIISRCSSRTVVNLYCSPGNVVSTPKLVSKDDCFFEIEWYTSAACVLSRKTGYGCRLEDSTAGYVFDLNPLKKDSGDYLVNGTDGYTYIINVCSKINDDKHCVSPPHDNASICQINAGTEFKVAEPSSQLEYFDGILNLTYTNGESYNNPEKTPRMAEIAFVCDPSVDTGNPEFLEEKNFTYAFLWRTNYACTLAPVECAVTNGETHEQFDLSSLSKVSGVWETEMPHRFRRQEDKVLHQWAVSMASRPHL
ncbi:Cation-independent mannose-6-phosphate receptor [Bulinus truncatus]|nr:Cation-independent mannose-6-phosphate receptor [Bulinus truncatus]